MTPITTLRFPLLIASLALFHGCVLYAQQPFLSEAQWSLLRDEASGWRPMRTCAA